MKVGNLYRSKENDKLYIIEHLIKDIYRLNNNANAGIYAYPFNHPAKTLTFLEKNKGKCLQWVSDNFKLVCHL